MSALQVARDARRKSTGSPNEELDILVSRLDVGWVMCDHETNPDRRARLEDHWLRLLGEYEAACDQDDPRSEPKPDVRFSGNGRQT